MHGRIPAKLATFRIPALGFLKINLFISFLVNMVTGRVFIFMFYKNKFSSDSSNLVNRSTPTLLIKRDISRSLIYSYILSKKYGSRLLSKFATTILV
jgi:hypothetical protein